MGALAAEAVKLLEASLSKNTWNSYVSVIEKFNQFRLSYNLDVSWPVSGSVMIAYIAFMSKEGYAHSSICLHTSALAFIHKINGWADPTNSFIVKKLKEGSKRLNNSSDSRRPITFDLLERIIAVLPMLCKSTYEAKLFKTVFILAYFAFLRLGEYACESKKKEGSHVIKLGDISISQGNFVEVCIRSSKTDQVGNSTLLKIMGIANINMCPVQAMIQYLAIRPDQAGPLFIHFDGEVLTKFQVNRVLNSCVVTVGLDPDDFSPHSFRIGAATSAAMQGIPEETIKNYGRWKSQAVRGYVRASQVIAFCN